MVPEQGKATGKCTTWKRKLILLTIKNGSISTTLWQNFHVSWGVTDSFWTAFDKKGRKPPVCTSVLALPPALAKQFAVAHHLSCSQAPVGRRL